MLGAEVEKRTITVAGFSKTYSMTGWRLGTLVAPAPIAKACAELQSQMSSNATTFAQYGALAALKEKDKAAAALTEMKTAFDRRRKFLHAELNKIPGVTCLLAQGAFYLFPNISSFGLKDVDFCAQLLETGEGRRRSRLGFRRRRLPPPQLRHERRNHQERRRTPRPLLRDVKELSFVTESTEAQSECAERCSYCEGEALWSHPISRCWRELFISTSTLGNSSIESTNPHAPVKSCAAVKGWRMTMQSIPAAIADFNPRAESSIATASLGFAPKRARAAR